MNCTCVESKRRVVTVEWSRWKTNLTDPTKEYRNNRINVEGGKTFQGSKFTEFGNGRARKRLGSKRIKRTNDSGVMNVEFTLRPGNEKSPFEFTELKRLLRSKRLYSNSVNEFHWISPKFIYFRGLQAFLSFMRVKRSDILSTSRMVNQTSQFFFSFSFSLFVVHRL